ncbi:MAG: class I SAM-dependent methyltransferase [Sandaracinaceae bacterium]
MTDVTERARRYYDDFSASYDDGRDRGYHALIDELEVGIVKPLAAGARVLEAGCGTGLILDHLTRVAREAVGVDLSPGMLSKARERGLRVVQGSVTALPFADESFDLTCSFKVLAHVPELDRALEEMARVTRPGGHVVIELYNRWSLRYLARRAAGARTIGRAHTEADIPTRWHSPREALAALPGSLEVIDVRGVRVVTPAAAVHRTALAPLVAATERALVGSPLRWFGGFLVVVARRR